MKKEPLSEALRSLPRERASEGFTRRVLEQLDKPGRRVVTNRFRPFLLAAASALLAVGLFVFTMPHEPQMTTERARLEALESERARLESELARMRQLVTDPGPREIYLGGNDQVEVVLDMGWSAVQRVDLEGSRSRVVPASYRPLPGQGL